MIMRMSLWFTHRGLYICWILGQECPFSCFHPHWYRSLSSHEYFLFYNIVLSHFSFFLHLRYCVLHYIASLMSLYLCLPLSLTCKLSYETLGLALYLTHSSYKVNHYYVAYEMIQSEVLLWMFQPWSGTLRHNILWNFKCVLRKEISLEAIK